MRLLRKMTEESRGARFLRKKNEKGKTDERERRVEKDRAIGRGIGHKIDFKLI
jgi:hypothetical protein